MPMNLSCFETHLRQHADQPLRFVLPDGDPMPAQVHVTEVGHVTKRFIDCGGTVRLTESCLLQTWVPEEESAHRLTAGKLARILGLARRVVPSDDLPVKVEYDCCVVGHYAVDAVALADDALEIRLVNKQTQCLARETCGAEVSGCGCGSESPGGKCC